MVHPLIGAKILEGPQDWQIIQRNSDGMADVTVQGTWTPGMWTSVPENDVNVQARIVDEETNAPVTHDLDWQDAVVDIENSRFEVTLANVPQGGLYRIETRIRRTGQDRRALRGDYIHHLGVGDIYLIAGQSNASGTGKGIVNDGPDLGVHLFGNDENWKLATHPLEDARGTLHPITATGIFHGHSPWLAFAKTVFHRTGIPIGLIPTAMGGSSIARWVKDAECRGDLLDNMKSMVTAAGGEIAGVLWYQGESDADPVNVELYSKRFVQFVNSVRDYVHQPELPILVGQLNRWMDPNADDSCWSAIRELQRQSALQLENVYLIVTIDSSLSDAIHNNAPSNVVIGHRYAMVAHQEIYGLPTMSQFPNPVSVCFVDRSRLCIRIEFEHVSGEWMVSAPQVTDFRVEAEHETVPVRSISLESDNSIRIDLERSPLGDVVVHGLFGANPMVSLRDDLGRCIVPFSILVTEIM